MSMRVKTMAEWSIENKEPEILFWVGSAGSFDDRAKKITRSFVKILNLANVDFGVLGVEESASGDVAKRAGNEFLFQMQALMNIQILDNYNVKRIVTTCPHDYNTLKNEYKDLGGSYEVLHHTEFIYELINDTRLVFENNTTKNSSITYHDPCYLGRGNEVYDIPRKLLKKVGYKLTEMPRSRNKSFCCGAGGAQMFKEPEKGNEDININRTTEALKTINVSDTSKCSKNKLIVTACPFCNTMMTDGVKNKNQESNVRVLDIVEIISEAKEIN
ncbi:MAG: CoB--CoM heterodisulfide reductase [Flavobacteriales bacterium]|nr:CoB--CoM heterodisulfide reductase [Flavobacteriales bacterium]|tara:strand:+ start:5845 stop:6663 length:819 start_codon:yes stop_codon:yes gene_type:complete